MEDGSPRGIVDARAVNTVPRESWATTPVSTISTPVQFCVAPEADAATLLSRLEDGNPLVPVLADGRVVGAVDLGRLMRFAQLRQELHIQVGSAPAAAV